MSVAAPRYPVRVEGELDAKLSRWLWLFKWLLAIPHYIVLAFLWIAFLILSVIALVAILFTGRYPRGIFDFNVGVLRWTWRVTFYAFGANGTDRYPPFTLAEADYPASFAVEYPAELSRGLVLVKWWLLAIPHYIVVGIFVGGGWAALNAGGGLVFVLVLFAVVALLFTGRYPRTIFDFVLGMHRWVLRVAAYAGLMTDQYPPFRLDMGGADPAVAVGRPVGAPVAGPAAGAPRWGAGRILLVVFGSLAAVVSVGLLAAGVAVLVIDQTQRDSDSYVMSPTEGYGTPTYALVSESFNTRVDGPDFAVRDFLGTVRLRSESDTPVFIGIAPEAEVDRYMAGVGLEQVSELGVDRSDYRLQAGGAPPAAPGAQAFWAASAEGAGTQTLSWDVESGNWAVVLMNADGSQFVDANLSIGARLPHLIWVWVGLLAAGAVLLGIAGLLIFVGVRRRDAEGGGPGEAPVPGDGGA